MAWDQAVIPNPRKKYNDPNAMPAKNRIMNILKEKKSP